MAEEQTPPTGPDLAQGVAIAASTDCVSDIIAAANFITRVLARASW